MAGFRDAEKARSGVRPHAVHPEVLGFIDQAVSERGSPPFDSSPEDAARALLRAKAGYDLGETSVAAFVLGRVALPEDYRGAPLVRDVLPERGRFFLEGFEAEMLRSDTYRVSRRTINDKNVVKTPRRN